MIHGESEVLRHLIHCIRKYESIFFLLGNFALLYDQITYAYYLANIAGTFGVGERVVF